MKIVGTVVHSKAGFANILIPRLASSNRTELRNFLAFNKTIMPDRCIITRDIGVSTIVLQILHGNHLSRQSRTRGKIGRLHVIGILKRMPQIACQRPLGWMLDLRCSDGVKVRGGPANLASFAWVSRLETPDLTNAASKDKAKSFMRVLVFSWESRCSLPRGSSVVSGVRTEDLVLILSLCPSLCPSLVSHRV